MTTQQTETQTETVMERATREHREWLERTYYQTPAGRFDRARISVEAIQRRLDRKAEGYTVESYTDSTDGYADYTGVKVTGPDVARAVRFLAAALRPDVARYRELAGGQHAVYAADEDTGVILMHRWSLGD